MEVTLNIDANVGYSNETLEVEYEYHPSYSETTEYFGVLKTIKYDSHYTVFRYKQIGMDGVCPLLDVCEQELENWMNN